jgi:ribosomal protein S24E
LQGHLRAASLCIERLRDAGVKVVEKLGAHQQFVALDKSTVWYGSIASLGYVKRYDSALRFRDVKIAEQLIKQAFWDEKG